MCEWSCRLRFVLEFHLMEWIQTAERVSVCHVSLRSMRVYRPSLIKPLFGRGLRHHFVFSVLKKDDPRHPA